MEENESTTIVGEVLSDFCLIAITLCAFDVT
jgi:hypothetical protein